MSLGAFYAPPPTPAASAHWGIERSDCPYARTCIRAYVRPSVDQVKMSVQGRISMPVNGSKLITHMRAYV